MAVVDLVEHELWSAQLVIDGVHRVGCHGAIDEPDAHEYGDGDASRAVGGVEVPEFLPVLMERAVADADGASLGAAGEVSEVRHAAECRLDVWAERRKEHAESAAMACARVADARPVDAPLSRILTSKAIRSAGYAGRWGIDCAQVERHAFACEV